ncbi:lysophospholipase-like [Yasminevirus sp. GU-2018]|uniref:Lysophospholipase-like n=1 Tax=Yasminevirus sp. GU-2018 TaxID=2420051 RepID=A0A5K0U897_9VIRU|nr:lysophospholipase-like [Yasminevirus sp. GU-2018]
MEKNKQIRHNENTVHSEHGKDVKNIKSNKGRPVKKSVNIVEPKPDSKTKKDKSNNKDDTQVNSQKKTKKAQVEDGTKVEKHLDTSSHSSQGSYKSHNASTATNENLNINDLLDVEVSQLLDRNIKRDRDILVLSGGSTKGVAQIGALHCLKKNNMLKNIKTIAATSAGSMVGLLYCAGYQPLELYKFIKLIDLEMVKKLDAHNVITKYGLDDGSRMMLVLKKLVRAKGFSEDITFSEFYKKTGITFIVTGSCINDKRVYYFSHNTNPEMKVMEAIRISISIPIVFTPCMHEGKIFVDGGCIDNFPIQLFDGELDRVIGVYVSENRKIVNEIKYIEDYLSNIIQCLFEGITHRDTKMHRCVVVIRCTQPGEKQTDIVNMFDEGYRATQQKIDTGDLA